MFVSVITTICALLYFAGLTFIYLKIKGIEGAYNNTESQSMKAEKAQALKSAAETNKEYIEILRQFFIKKDDEVEFIKQIEDIGNKSKIAFSITKAKLFP